MIAMLFEFWIDNSHQEAYIEYSRRMRQLVNDIDGFISIERYHSASDPDKILAVGFFRDEDAVTQWRNHPEHRQAQALGQTQFFTDYRLIMADVTRDYDRTSREQAPADSQQFHDING